MVATSRLRGAQTKMENFRPYAGKFAEVLGSLAEKAGEEASPFLMPREEVKKIHVVLCTSDRGLVRWIQYQPDRKSRMPCRGKGR